MRTLLVSRLLDVKSETICPLLLPGHHNSFLELKKNRAVGCGLLSGPPGFVPWGGF